MKKELSVAIVASLIFSAIMPFVVAIDIKTGKNNESFFQDGRFIKKLEWTSPNGELPTTYDEYISKHPLKSARFLTPPLFENQLNFIFDRDTNIKLQQMMQTKGIYATVESMPRPFLSVLVDEELYPSISTSLGQYKQDLKNEKIPIFVQTVSGGTPADIKAWITEQYNHGSIGALLIGDITVAWAEVSGDVFPCDLFYMDLDGNWEDNDHDGDYEIHTSGNGDMGPEIYVARIYTSTLTYDTEANMVNEYFAKAHSYRTGTLVQPWRGLEYIDEDWYDMDVNLNLIYNDSVTRYDYGYFTTAADYLNQMDLGQHFVQVCAHSYSGGHVFGTRPTESVVYAHVYVYSPTARYARLLLGCDDGIKVWLNWDNVYTNDRYGSWKKDKYEVDVWLRAGWNRLLCKISQGGGDYEFSARFTDMNYNSFDDLIYQINHPWYYPGEAPYIRSWLLNGFHQDIPDNFWYYLNTNYLGVDEASADPHEGEIMGGKTWTRYDSGAPYIDMGDYCNNADYGVCYAYARIYADTEKSCQLWMGYDDGARVWLNGQQIIFDNRYGGYEADMTKVNVNLNAGINRLMIKISEWMGEHGFSARLCNPDGSTVDGLTYDPDPLPISYIGTWLTNGPYVNPEQSTRLTTDYLGNETNVTPSEGQSAPFGVWERAIGNGCPFDIGAFYNHEDWVYSSDIQNRDPPVLFYNLFACGPGRFVDTDYLAGAYIFHTTWGLITIASSKSGSMLNFDDFTRPIGQGKCIGEAFKEWFDAQAPFEQWEKEWYYGMILNGDPLLIVKQ